MGYDDISAKDVYNVFIHKNSKLIILNCVNTFEGFFRILLRLHGYKIIDLVNFSILDNNIIILFVNINSNIIHSWFLHYNS